MWAKVRKVTLLEGRVFGIKCVKFDVFMLLSSDLIHWSEQQAIPVMMHEPTAHNWYRFPHLQV